MKNAPTCVHSTSFSDPPPPLLRHSMRAMASLGARLLALPTMARALPPAARRALSPPRRCPRSSGPAPRRDARRWTASLSSAPPFARRRADARCPTARRPRRRARRRARAVAGAPAGSGRSRHGPDGARRGVVATDAPGAPPSPCGRISTWRSSDRFSAQRAGGWRRAHEQPREFPRGLWTTPSCARSPNRTCARPRRRRAVSRGRCGTRRGDEDHQALRVVRRPLRRRQVVARAPRRRQDGDEIPRTRRRTKRPLPEDDVSIPEVAFAGRSNVGKSSLINAVTLSSAAKQRRPGEGSR